jgi:hypothetical protein
VLGIHHYSLLYTPCWSRSYFRVRLDLVLQSEYNLCLSLSRPLLLQSEYNFCLSPSRPLLPQSEYTICLNLSRPYILPRERESVCGKSVCGQLLIRSIFVLLFNFEVPLKNYQKKLQRKNRKKKQDQKSSNKERALCVFSFLSYRGGL